MDTDVRAGDEGFPDALQDAIVSYGVNIRYELLTATVVDAATTRIVDTLAGLMAGLPGETCERARRLAAAVFGSDQAAVIGTGQRTTVDMAAFVNGTTARYSEMNDMYHRPRQPGGHPSDVIMPLFAVAEYRACSGAEFVAAVACAYELVLDLLDATRLRNFDATVLIGLAVAVGSAKLLDLDHEQMRQAVSLVAVPNNPLRRSRIGALSMWKAAASGQAGRAGVFAALLAEQGIDGPTLPFEGEAGWLANVAGGEVHLAPFVEGRSASRLGDTILKPRGACGTAISSIMAAERVFDPARAPEDIDNVVVETYEEASRRLAQPLAWAPNTRESADHSIPYVVAATLVDGTIGPQQFDDEHLADVRIRRLMQRIEVRECEEFTRAYERPPYHHRTRVSVASRTGTVDVGEFGGEHGDLYDMGRSAVGDKFVQLASGPLGGESRAREALTCLWALEGTSNVAELVPLLTT